MATGCGVGGNVNVNRKAQCGAILGRTNGFRNFGGYCLDSKRLHSCLVQARFGAANAALQVKNERRNAESLSGRNAQPVLSCGEKRQKGRTKFSLGLTC